MYNNEVDVIRTTTTIDTNILLFFSVEVTFVSTKICRLKINLYDFCFQPALEILKQSSIVLIQFDDVVKSTRA